ncbi:MAG: hypothetical protein V2A56_01065 [bacterium]
MLQTEQPVASIRALMDGLIDYAGLFPPAELSMEQAIQTYATYRLSPDAWMINTFVVPANRLSELADHSGHFYTNPPYRFTITGRGGTAMGDFLSGSDKDLMDARRFLEIHGDYVRIERYEVRLPEDVLEGVSSRRMGDILAGVVDRLESSLQAQPRIFIEASWRKNWRQRFNALISELSRLNRDRDLDNALGFKLRCGGTTAGDVPPSDFVAGAIYSAARSHLPMKFTAGLHHPLRQYRDNFGIDMHGFINVFVAGALVHTLKLDEFQIRDIIDERDLDAFHLDETEVGWRELRISIADFRKARSEFVIGYGSCSFDEPRSNLQSMGILPGKM